jgi:hypothetical protein
VTETVDIPTATPPTGSRSSSLSDRWLRVPLPIWAAVITVLGGIGGALIQRSAADAPAPLIPPSLTVTTLSKGGVNPVDVTSASTAEVAVAGEVRGTLRDGQAVFVLWRQYDGEASKNVSAGTVYSGLPCVVNGHKFECDSPWLGSRPDSGISLLWVGIADSTATRSLSFAYAKQRESGVEGDGPQQEPNGFNVEGTFRLHWPQS